MFAATKNCKPLGSAQDTDLSTSTGRFMDAQPSGSPFGASSHRATPSLKTACSPFGPAPDDRIGSSLRTPTFANQPPQITVDLPKPQRHHSILGANRSGSTNPKERVASQLVISKIEEQFASIAQGLQRKKEVSIVIKRKTKSKRSAGDFSDTDDTHQIREVPLRFSGRTPNEAWIFGK